MGSGADPDTGAGGPYPTFGFLAFDHVAFPELDIRQVLSVNIRLARCHTPIQHASADAKGNFGEVMADQNMRDQGFDPIHPNPPRQIGDGSTGQGIDSVWRDPGPPPRYIVSESKYRTDTPFDPSEFPMTNSGPQMEERWIEDRFEGIFNADQLREIDGTGYERVLQRISPDGKVENIDLDSNNSSWR